MDSAVLISIPSAVDFARYLSMTYMYINSTGYELDGILIVHVDSVDCVSTLSFIGYESKYLTYGLL